MKTTRISGNHFQIGEALGELASPHLPAHLAQSLAWSALEPWRGHAFLAYIQEQIQQCMPELWQELEGMAFALEMPVRDLLLWNCRGDFLPKLDLVPEPAIAADSSTSLAAASDTTRWLAHQQTLEIPAAHCTLVDIRFTHPSSAPGFTALYQPGTLPGCGFSANHLGIVQVSDSLWPSGDVSIDPGLPRVPRIFLSRAILDCQTMDHVLHLLGSTSCLGGLHLLLCSAQDHLLWSVETAPGVASYEEIIHYYAHSNHMRHADTAQRPQYIPPASLARYQTVSMRPELTQTGLLTTLHAGQTHLPPAQAQISALFEINPGQVNLHLQPSPDSRQAGQVVEICPPAAQTAAQTTNTPPG